MTSDGTAGGSIVPHNCLNSVDSLVAEVEGALQ